MIYSLITFLTFIIISFHGVNGDFSNIDVNGVAVNDILTSGGGALIGAAPAAADGVDLNGFFHPTSTTWDDTGHVYVAEKAGKV
jgi:hypothetical protein